MLSSLKAGFATCFRSVYGECGLTHAALRGAIKALSLALLIGVPGAATAEPSQPLRIVAFGDSLVAGYGLPPQDGFVPRLQVHLDAASDVPVRLENAGVSGDTTAGGLARLDWTLGGAQIDAMILELGANDALRGIDPADTRANLRGILARMQERGIPVLLAGMLAPRNLGEDYVREFDAIYPELAKEFNSVLMPFFLEGVAGDPALNQDDRIHPNADGVAVIVEAIAPYMDELVARARAD